MAERYIHYFHVADYVVFVLMLGVSAAIGVYFDRTGGRQKTTSEYLLADRKLRIIPTAASCLMSVLSAILVLGSSAEMYTAGAMYYVGTLGFVLPYIFGAWICIPLIYPLKLNSLFEFLEMRYKSRRARKLGSLINILSMVIYAAMCMYAPSTALEAVSGIPYWASILVCGAVGVFYTTLGGIKAVVWTDLFQGVVVLFGMCFIAIKGSLIVGGFGRVWELNREGNRTTFFDFNPDPFVRHTFWGLVIGNAIKLTGAFAFNQMFVQRYTALPSVREAQKTVILMVPMSVILKTLCCWVGLVVYAYYAQTRCDPLKAGYISNQNQILPYFMMDVLGYPGLPGLFVASLYAGALSSISSVMNSCATITWHDFLKPYFEHHTEERKTIYTKIMVLCYGIISIILGFLIQFMKGHILQAAIAMFGVIKGPLMGLFMLGILFPWANAKGGIIGLFAGITMGGWIMVGAYTNKDIITKYVLPTFIDNCPGQLNQTLMDATTMVTTMAPTPKVITGIKRMYMLSYTWWGVLAIGTTMFVGLIASFITGATDPKTVNPRYTIPLFDWACCCLPIPKRWRQKLRCGVRYGEHEEWDIDSKHTGMPREDDLDAERVPMSAVLDEPRKTSANGV